MKKQIYYLIFLALPLFVLYACKKKESDSPASEPTLKIDVKTQLFPSYTTSNDTIQAKLGSVCVMDITVYKGMSPIKQITVSRTDISNNTTQILKDTLYNTLNDMIKISVSSNAGNITTLWKYEITAKDENNTFKKYIHIRTGQNCPSLTLSFLGFTNADSNRIKVQGGGLTSATSYQYSYDNGITWTIYFQNIRHKNHIRKR